MSVKKKAQAKGRPSEEMDLMPELKGVLDYIDGVRERSKSGREQFEQLGCYCTFVGYPRSGHSLVGSLLDAHPDAVIAHELNALRCVQAHFSQHMIFQLILENTRLFNERNREWTGYHYGVPNQWQGRFRTIKVIGDKKGGGTSAILRGRPGLLKRLETTFSVPVRYIHVVRNPYDNISTIAIRSDGDLDRAIGFYFSLVNSVLMTRKHAGVEGMINVRHENLIAKPQDELRRLCKFLGLAVEEDWLAASAAIVRPEAHKSRLEIEGWTPERIETVAKAINQVPFLKGYTFVD